MAGLTFEIARELFDAGFPQDNTKPELFFDDEGTLVVRHPSLPFPRMGAYRAPGLGTLVDTCGSHLHALIQQRDGWYANGLKGETAEIAVARLWIAYFGAAMLERKAG